MCSKYSARYLLEGQEGAHVDHAYKLLVASNRSWLLQQSLFCYVVGRGGGGGVLMGGRACHPAFAGGCCCTVCHITVAQTSSKGRARGWRALFAGTRARKLLVVVVVFR